MNINGLDYNTERKKLILSEYGREIQKMVEHAISLADKAERQRCANTIVKTMHRISPSIDNSSDADRKYWEQLAIIADFKLDIDYPYDISAAHNISEKPARLEYKHSNIPIRHYGAVVFELIEKLKTMPEGEEKERLVALTANRMKACLTEYGQGSDDEEKVAYDLYDFTEGNVRLNLDTFVFNTYRPSRQHTEKKRKRK